MDDLIAWFRGVLDEDEAVVRRFTHGYDSDTTAADWKLADVAAKRAILDLHKPIVVSGLPPAFCAECQIPWLCQTVRLLASAYADRPGYREEWRP